MELLELALPIAVGQAIRDRIQENINTVKGNLEYGACWFCKENPSEPKATLDVKMYGDVTRTPTWKGVEIQWRHLTVKVPRCVPCKSTHGLWTGVGVALSVILGLGGCMMGSALDNGYIMLVGFILFRCLSILENALAVLSALHYVQRA